MRRPLAHRFALLATLATTGCNVQISNPFVNIGPPGIQITGDPPPTAKPTPPVGPVMPPLPPRDPDGLGCEDLGPGSPAFTFPAPPPVACPAIYPPPPGCDTASLQGPYREFAGLRAPAAFRGLPDAQAVRQRLDRLYEATHPGKPRPGVPRPLGPHGGPLLESQADQRMVKAAPAARRTLMTSPPHPGYYWECLERGYPELVAAYLQGGPITEPPSPPTPEPWFPEPCDYAPSQTVTLSGSVFDGQGTPFPGEVEVLVATSDYGFNTTAEVIDGQWQVSGAPAGARLQVTARHVPSGESRRRFVVPQPAFVECGQEGYATVNFGGPVSDADPLGHRYAMGVSAPEPAPTRTSLTARVFNVAGKPLPGATLVLRAIHPTLSYKRALRADGGGGLVPVPGAFRGLQLEEMPAVSVAPPMGPEPISAIASATFEDAPTDALLELRAEAEGHLPVVRLIEPLSAKRTYTFSLGGPATRQDPSAPQYALVAIPERPGTERVTVVGRAFLQDSGAPVTEGVARLESEIGDPSQQQEVRLNPDGGFAFKGVMARTRAAITVEVPGYMPMRRKVRIGAGLQTVTFNFGGPSTRTDPLAPSFGLVKGLD